MQGRLHVDSLKSAGNGPIHSPVSNPIKNKTNQKRQTNKQNTPKHNHTKNQTRHREVGSLPALRNKMHDDILCVIMSMARKRSKTKTTRKNTRGPYKRVKEAMLHFSICACHPCAGAMLIFSVSFQFYRMIPKGNPYWHKDKARLRGTRNYIILLLKSQ